MEQSEHAEQHCVSEVKRNTKKNVKEITHTHTHANTHTHTRTQTHTHTHTHANTHTHTHTQTRKDDRKPHSCTAFSSEMFLISFIFGDHLF